MKIRSYTLFDQNDKILIEDEADVRYILNACLTSEEYHELETMTPNESDRSMVFTPPPDLCDDLLLSGGKVDIYIEEYDNDDEHEFFSV